MLNAQPENLTPQESAAATADSAPAAPAEQQDQSLKIQALQAAALEAWERDKCGALELGHALIAVRDAMQGHGDFAAWWRGAGMDENRVYYCVRLAQGKIASKPTLPKEPYQVNAKMLAVARAVCPQLDGKFTKAAVHLGPDGLTTTDGFVLVRVGFQENASVPAGDGASVSRRFCENLLSVMDRRALVQIYAGKEQTKAVTLDGNIIAPAGSEFPIDQSQHILDGVAAKQTVIRFAVKKDSLQKLLEVAAMSPDDYIELRVTEEFLCMETEDTAQHLVALVKTLKR